MIKYPDNKQKNDKEFIQSFIAFMQSKDASHYEFKGLNPYNAHVSLINNTDEEYNKGNHFSSFLIEYNKWFVKVFAVGTDKNSIEQYISLHGDEAKHILDILFERFKEWGGF